MNRDQIVDDLSRFADLDWPVTQSDTDSGWAISFRQQGVEVRIGFNEDGTVSEWRGGAQSKYSSFAGLLASESFGDLRQLARMQLVLVQRTAGVVGSALIEPIPVVGELSVPSGVTQSGPLLEQIDDWTASPGSIDDVHALVVDGPAGIGKTHLIIALVEQRAKRFGPASRPLLLHVQSQGRQLTTLPDLLARTLQTMRLKLTYDQVPILVRHGLLQVAIDGFDELADPNGYETAWRSLRDLISEIRGRGVLVLAGRDTFIDADSVRRALPILSSTAVASLHLRSPSSREAVAWLNRTGLSDQRLQMIESARLLEEGSYALRPFFLKQIRTVADSSEGMDLLAAFPLGTLVDAMINRELPIAKSLGLEVSLDVLQRLLAQFFREVAREMADSESDSIDVASLQLLAEIVFGPHVPEDSLRALRNRVKSIALLDADSIPDRRRFVHSEIQAFFLSHAYLELLAGESIEIARSLRRSILGSELLEIFHDVSRSVASDVIDRFRETSVRVLKGRRLDDRSPTNIAALLLASLDVTRSEGAPILVEDTLVDECLLRGSTGAATLRRVTISKLDARGADASELTFEDSVVVSLLADASSRLPNALPTPQVLTIDSNGRQQVIYDPEEIRAWVARVDVRTTSDGSGSSAISATVRLLDKACRTILRQGWIRDLDSDRAGRLVRDQNWPALRDVLQRHGLLEERTLVPAGGKRSRFVRVKRATALLNADFQDTAIADVYRDLANLP